MVSFCASLLDMYICKVYLLTHDQNKLAPTLRNLIDVSKCKYIQVAPETVWSLIQRSRDVGCSRAQTFAVRLFYQQQAAAIPVPTSR